MRAFQSSPAQLVVNLEETSIVKHLLSFDASGVNNEEREIVIDWIVRHLHISVCGFQQGG